MTIGLLLALAGCDPSRGCVETCEHVVADGCAAPGMEACPALCDGLAAEAEQSGCTEAWLDLEYCMGLDPVCAGHSRCGAERGAYNDCSRAYCVASPDACSP
ncbi:MAG: hypothetical protein H6719_17515 [Sandaracinaceae bacterium]|nr:hypothetical protein [Sandaracinaceae bacterium]